MIDIFNDAIAFTVQTLIVPYLSIPHRGPTFFSVAKSVHWRFDMKRIKVHPTYTRRKKTTKNNHCALFERDVHHIICIPNIEGIIALVIFELTS